MSTATNKMYYLCTAELMELVPIRFMVTMVNKRINQKQINILEELDHDNHGMMQLLYCFKTACIRYNIQKLDDHIIDAFVNMLDFRDVAMKQQDANRTMGKIKKSISAFY